MKFRRFLNLGISTKLSVSFTLIYIFAILIIIFIFFWGVPFTSIDGQIEVDRLEFFKVLNLAANMKKNQIENWIQDRRADIEIISSNTYIAEDVTGLHLKLMSLLEEGAALSEFRSKILVDESFSDLSSFLENITNTSSFYSDIHIADPDTGIVFISTDANSLGLNLSGMHCFHDTLLSETVHIGDCLVNSGSTTSIIHFSHVLKDKRNSTIGVLVMVVTQDAVKSLLFSSPNGFKVREEMILVNNRAEILMPLKYPLSNGETAEINKYRIDALPVKFAVRGEEGIIDSVDYRGERVLAAYRYIRMNTNWGWGLVVKRDYSELINPLRVKIITALVIGSIGGIILGLITVLITRGITSPIRSLKRTSELITSGNLSVRAVIKSNDEIGVLAKAFNHMTDNLVEAKENLEVKVMERTRSLEEEIIEHRIAEESIRKLSFAVSQSPSIVIISDTNFNIEYVNPMFTQISGYLPEEVIGKNPIFLNTGDFSYESWEKMMSKIINGQIQREVFHNKKKNGEEYWVSVSISGIKDENGILTNILEVQEDISKEKGLKEQLVQAQKLEAIGTLASGVAHDFNNILSIVLGYSDYLLSKLDKEDYIYPIMEDIKDASTRGASLTQQLLAFGRKQSIKIIPLALNNVIKGIERMLARLMMENVKVLLKLEEDLWTIEADEGQIVQVLMNLAVNSSHAMPEGGSLTISSGNINFQISDMELNPRLRAGDFVFLSIKDTGCGMDEETISRIFDPFFTTKAIGIGTGLGLSVVYGIVEQHKGWINVKSEPGKGSEFKIFLPALEMQEQVETEVKPLSFRKMGEGERILLVEDDKALRDFAVRVLTENGYIVFSAAGVTEVFDRFDVESGAFDLVFSDVMLPDVNGVKLVEFLLERNTELKVLLTSGYTDEKSHWMHIQKKGYNFLQKPYTIDTLLNKIVEVLGKS